MLAMTTTIAAPNIPRQGKDKAAARRLERYWHACTHALMDEFDQWLLSAGYSAKSSYFRGAAVRTAAELFGDALLTTPPAIVFERVSRAFVAQNLAPSTIDMYQKALRKLTEFLLYKNGRPIASPPCGPRPRAPAPEAPRRRSAPTAASLPEACHPHAAAPAPPRP